MLDIASGSVLSDRYTVGEQLGVGGTGVVWQAHDDVLDREVALKVVRNGEHARLRREAKAAARVNDRNVVTVHDAGQDGATVFLVMELVRGVDLGQVLKICGPLPPELVALVGHDLAKGLGAVHEQSIIHRDIKPSNVLLTAEGDVKLSDLGIARTSDATQTVQLTETGTIVGTIDYLAPEQLADDSNVTPAADVYALGLLLLETATGQKPFGEGTLAERAARRLARSPEPPAELAPELREAITAAVRRDPQDRPQDGFALARRLESIIEPDARAHLAQLVRRTAAAPAEDRLPSGMTPSPRVHQPTQAYTPTGVEKKDVVAPQTDEADDTPSSPAEVVANLPPLGRLAVEAGGLALLIVLVVLVATTITG